MPLPTLPDADELVIAAIKAAISGVNIGTQIPADLATQLKTAPFVMAVRFGGASVDPRFLDRSTHQIDVWAATRKAAFNTSSQIRNALRDAAANQTTYTSGHIVRFREISGPAEIRTSDQLDGVWRFTASYSLFLRPTP